MYYDRDGYPIQRQSGGAMWAMVIIMALCAAGFFAFLYPDLAYMPEQAKGAVGGQAPAAVRGTNRGSDTRVSTPPEAAINDYNATAQAQYDAAIEAGNQGAVLVLESATPPPLPLNSAGEPVINQEQANQQRQSLGMAEQEGGAAVDQQLAAQRDAQNAADLARPPDVSYQEAVDLLHRDPCHVPRANPATCSQGLYKPTPVH